MKRSFVKPCTVGKTQESKLTAATLIKGWFQHRKDAVKILEELTQGTIILAEAPYRGHGKRHLMQHTCGYRFLASLKEIAVHGTESCPYCYSENIVDLKQFGSVEAVQELVTIMVDNRITFLNSNSLGHMDDAYAFYCHIHDEPIQASFRAFIKNPGEICVECFFDALLKRPILLSSEEDN